MEPLAFDAPLWETALRGTVVYFVVAALMRLIPKRQTGNLSPNDLIALVIVGNLAGGGILGESKALGDILLLVAVILAWDYVLNMLEYYLPRFRRVAQDSPTLLVHNGRILSANLRQEKGVLDLGRVKLTVLEVDGQVSVVEKD